MKLPWSDSRNEKYFKCVLPEFLNPGLETADVFDAQGFGLSHYAANSRVLGGPTPVTLAAVGDGQANTILFGEINANFQPWGQPVNWRDPAKGINKTRYGFGGPMGQDGA